MYWSAVIASLVFYWAYREWMSWLLLVIVAVLPWLSLGLSLQAMARIELRVAAPERVGQGQHVQLALLGSCSLPQPPVRGRMRLENPMTGESLTLRSGESLPTEHCGTWHIRLEKAKVYDYMGLFVHRIRSHEPALTYVFPEEKPMASPPDLQEYLATAFKPKRGGGYAENHELRLYRPGDNLHQIHWKLTAKTGKLILREPMEPIKGKAVVSLELSGSLELVDRKLGRLRWLCRWLLEEGVPHEVHCLTAEGVRVFAVEYSQQVDVALQGILKQPLAAENDRIDFIAASWRYHIGGDTV